MEQRIIDLIALLEKEGLELPRDFAAPMMAGPMDAPTPQKQCNQLMCRLA